MVTFLSKTVAGKAGLDGNGEISRVKVTCKQLQHNTSSAPALLGLEIGFSLMLLAAVTLLHLGLHSVPRLGYHTAHADGQACCTWPSQLPLLCAQAEEAAWVDQLTLSPSRTLSMLGEVRAAWNSYPSCTTTLAASAALGNSKTAAATTHTHTPTELRTDAGRNMAHH
jgi:hypothetical protein